MPKRMLIDASHPEETRVVVLDGNKVEEFDFEAASKRPLKGNIYLAKVTRVEPSLQAAFVEYGGNRQGFLAFSEIHPDYYQIPVADRMALLEAQTQRMMAEDDFDSVATAEAPSQGAALASEQADEHGGEHADDHADESHGETGGDFTEDRGHDDDAAPHEDEGGGAHDAAASAEDEHEGEHSDGEETNEAAANRDSGLTTLEAGETEGQPAGEPSREAVQTESTGAPQNFQRRDRRNDRPRPPRRRQYKIQEVIKRRQIILVQVVKEERGNKGASLTTFLSLAGRYCVLMPNTPRGGGISRKITNAVDRKRLKAAAQSLELPQGMGLIIRTAGANRTKVEIKRDYEYLLRLWDTVRELTLKSNAPALVYEEGSLIKRTIRDLYNKDIGEVLVDGDNGYRDAKEFMRMIMPSHAKNVKPYKEPVPLFQRFHVEAQLDAMFSPTVTLKSGGYIVINQTEALVSIDVNSGKATREHSIEETAHKTNLEAADEIGRQLRLRDLAGLIVIDFIDMEDSRNDRNVEKRLHNAVRGDRARVQIGKISQFGLMEMSRQRLRAGVLAGSTVTCPHCAGMGLIRSTESAALRLLRSLEEEGQKSPAANISVKAPTDVTIYTLNQKRAEIARIEEAYDLAIVFDPQASMMGGSFEIERTGVRIPSPRPKAVPVSVEAGFQSSESDEPETDVTLAEAPAELETESEETEAEGQTRPEGQGEGQGQGEGRRRRRRRRRGGRGRNGQPQPFQQGQGIEAQGASSFENAPTGEAMPDDGADGERDEAEGTENATEDGAQNVPQSGQPQGEGGGRRRRRRRGRRGRRRDGEPMGQNGESRSFGGEPQQTESTADFEPHYDAPALPGASTPEQVPNAPSSPQWSLTAPEPEPSPRTAEREPAVQSIPEPEPSSAEEPAQESGEPRESRKGWWQRRFKI